MNDRSRSEDETNLDEVFASSPYAKRPWYEYYPPDAPRAYESPRFGHLVEIFDYAAEQWPERTAFSQFSRSLSYAQVRAESECIQTYLNQHCNAQDRVAIMLPNCLAQPIIFQAIARARMVVVNINPQYTARELTEVLNDARPAAIFIWDGALPILKQCDSLPALPKTVVVSLFDYLPTYKRILLTAVLRYVKGILPALVMPDDAVRLSSVRTEHKPASPKPDQDHTGDATQKFSPDDVALLQYTGGTTGLPKGAMLTHANLVANVLQICSYLDSDLKDPNKQQVVITPLPLYHIFALTVNHLLFYLLGGENRLIANPRKLDTVIAVLKQRPPFNVFVGVNTLFQSLLEHKRFPKLNFSGLRWSIGGGMQVREETAHHWRKKTGQILLQGYGLTEASPVVCFNPGTVDSFNGSIGLPIPGTDVMIVDEHNQAVPIGKEGELLVRGAQVMKGYWHKPTETAQCLQGGWLRTGDMATMNERGYFFIVDRLKDIINVSGFKIYPNEIEAVVESHRYVRECACVGVLDADGCEQVKIAVVRVAGSTTTTEELLIWLRKQLTSYKIPRYIEWVDSLDKSNVGKILRRVVRDKHDSSQATNLVSATDTGETDNR